MQNILASLKGLGRKQLAALGGAAAVLLTILGFLVFQGGGQTMALLYGDVDLGEAAEMIDDLAKAHISSTTSPDGTSIYVPRDKVASARLLLAKDGLPSGGAVGYELFDKSGTLTSTQFEQTINETRAMEGELERSIRLVHGVRNVRVHLVLPHRDLFSTQTSPSQASVVLDIGRAGRMAPDGIQAIQNLVAAAVPGLRPQNISIVDTRGDVLVKPGDPDSAAGQESTIEKLQHAEEQRLAQDVEDMLVPTLGAGHVRARAAVTMATDEIHETDESYDPNQQVLRSEQTTSDKSVNTEASPNTTVSNNLPNANANQDNKTGSSDDREEDTNNYEIGKRVRVISQTRPRVSRISLAVMVDGMVTRDKNGKDVWQPLDTAEIQNITTLAKTAIGYDQSRGDEVNVVSMRFMPDGGLGFPTSTGSVLSRDTLIYIAEWVIPIILALGAIFIGIRPMLRRGAINLPALAAGHLQEGLPGIAGHAGRIGNEMTGALIPSAHIGSDGTVSIDGIEGKMRAEAIAKVASRIEESTQESVLIIRNWLAEPDPGKRG
ncbi:flagellar M-ring protein FliF [Gluconacetobacter diazotrophicus]|uniref:Flagellar M-ring protein n=2 Tax=Gluconacetobacter diazotrophicus TaxID=33996 RepID=A9HHC2_GLUDA|nr:flagellar basal-body MS-ring/collar protein FliF [Gluconacetobacter diazotrophicus]MBB2156066.1 flagellar M-ring protein FliF [Gluconacetobacter diazotrophicus]TWB10443.1 flagellar M-ring protein FliF [Gluconacetobacter diazotrophicus]CAP55619.1 putative flagellar M-ring protein [Gluconacetobacter diazotrophicus PA1 5]